MANVFDPNDLKIVQELKNELRELKAIFTDLAKQVKTTQESFNKQSSTQDDLKTKSQQLTAIEKELNRIEKAGEKITKETALANQKLAQKRKQYNEEAKNTLGITQKSNGLFKSMTKSILAAGAAFLSFRAALNVVKNGFNAIKDFERGMSEVKAITGATAEEFKKLQANAIRLGSTTEKTSLEVAGLQKEFSKLGFTTTEIIAATEATIDLSIAAGSDLAESAVVAASTIRGFGLSTAQTGRVVDVMAKSFTSSALDLEKFKTAMAIVAPVANSFGKDIEFTTAQLSVLSDAGMDASTTGTSLRNMFLELSIRGLTWEQGLEAINNSTNKNVTALKLFGKRGATAALILADNIEKANGLEEAYDNARGSALEMAQVMADNLAGDINKAESAWDGFIKSLNQGETTISQSSRVLVKFATDVINHLSDPEIYKKWNRGNKLIAEDYDKFIEQANMLESNQGRTLQSIIQTAEKYGILSRSNAEFFDSISTGTDEAKNEFLGMLDFLGIEVDKQLGLWEAYVRKRRSLYENELQAELDAQAAKLKEEKRLLYAAGIEKAEKEIEAEEKAKKAKWEAKLKEGELLRQADQERFKQEADIEKNINKELAKIDAEWMDLRLDNEKTITEKLIKGEKLFTEAFNKQAEERAATEEKNAEKRKELNREIASAIISGASSLATELSNLNNIEYENEIGSLERKRDAEIENAEKTGRDITAINTKYDTLIKKKQYEQLQNQKKAAKFQAAISAATIILNALKTEPFVPLGLIMSGVAATIAGVQIAAINKQSVPKFGYGSDGKLQKDTFATIGDRYQHEAVIMPDGSLMFSDNKPQNVLLPANSQVLSGEQTREFIQDRGLDTALMKQMIIQQRETTKAVRKLSRITRTDSRIIEEGDNYRNSYIR